MKPKNISMVSKNNNKKARKPKKGHPWGMSKRDAKKYDSLKSSESQTS